VGGNAGVLRCLATNGSESLVFHDGNSHLPFPLPGIVVPCVGVQSCCSRLSVDSAVSLVLLGMYVGCHTYVSSCGVTM